MTNTGNKMLDASLDSMEQGEFLLFADYAPEVGERVEIHIPLGSLYPINAILDNDKSLVRTNDTGSVSAETTVAVEAEGLDANFQDVSLVKNSKYERVIVAERALKIGEAVLDLLIDDRGFPMPFVGKFKNPRGDL